MKKSIFLVKSMRSLSFYIGVKTSNKYSLELSQSKFFLKNLNFKLFSNVLVNFKSAGYFK